MLHSDAFWERGRPKRELLRVYDFNAIHAGSNKPVNMIIGGWTVSSFLSYESGTPNTVASGASPIGTGSRVFITSYEAGELQSSARSSIRTRTSGTTRTPFEGDAGFSIRQCHAQQSQAPYTELQRERRDRLQFPLRRTPFLRYPRGGVQRPRSRPVGCGEQRDHQRHFRPRDDAGQHPAPHADLYEAVLLASRCLVPLSCRSSLA